MHRDHRFGKAASRSFLAFLAVVGISSAVLWARGYFVQDFIRISTSHHRYYVMAESRRGVLFVGFGHQHQELFARQPLAFWQKDASQPTGPYVADIINDPSTTFEIDLTGFQFSRFKAMPSLPEAGITFALPEGWTLLLAATAAGLMVLRHRTRRKLSRGPAVGEATPSVSVPAHGRAVRRWREKIQPGYPLPATGPLICSLLDKRGTNVV